MGWLVNMLQPETKTCMCAEMHFSMCAAGSRALNMFFITAVL